MTNSTRALIIGLLMFHASVEAKESYWNYKISSKPPSCAELVEPLSRLKGIFNARHGSDCKISDEQDHILFTCGKKLEVVVFTEEECDVWSKKKLSKHREQKMVAFQGCFQKAKGNLGHGVASQYCKCMSVEVSKYSERQLADLGEAKLTELMRPIAAKCMPGSSK